MSMTYFPNDFRSTSPSLFQALRSLCNLIEMTMNNNLMDLYSNQYISTFITPRNLFHLQMTIRFEQFKSSTIRNLLLSLSMIQSTIHNNALSSGLQTNYRQFIANNEVISSAVDYQDCSCLSSASCIDQSRIYNYPNMTSLFNVPGFYTGCYVIQSLLQSNLQCFYDQNCIDQLQTYLNPTSMKVTALNSSLSNRYIQNTTIGELLHELMIEQWTTSTDYDRYYHECQPVQCAYGTIEMVETVERIDMKTYILCLIGILIGIVGSLIAILNLIVPRLVKPIVYGIYNRKNQTISEMPMVITSLT